MMRKGSAVCRVHIVQKYLSEGPPDIIIFTLDAAFTPHDVLLAYERALADGQEASEGQVPYAIRKVCEHFGAAYDIFASDAEYCVAEPAV